MCGIFGYIGDKKNAGELILNGLKSLEYRGYDSWGVAVKKGNNDLYIEKHTGKIGDASLPELSTMIGIGHTRWATHGGVQKANAHPHISCDKEIVIVHNGIVENFTELKRDLLKKGHIFKSETDSEVLAHQLEELLKSESDLQSAVYTLKAMIRGMNAVIAFFPKKGTFYIFKNGSPIVIGKGKNEYFIASDASAIIPHTKEVYFVEDGETICLKKDEITLFGIHGKTKKIKYMKLSYDAEAVTRGKFDHFMLKEIYEQPTVVTNIASSQTGAIKEVAKRIRKAYGTYLVGCGTASYACLAGTYLFSKIAKRHINFSIGSEFSYLLDFLKDTSLVIALSQSGETIDIIDSVQKAKKKKAELVALTNVLGSTLYRMADYSMLLSAGPEKAVASTKAYTAKIAFLYLIAHELEGSLQHGILNIQKAVNEIDGLLDRKNRIKKLTGQIKNHDHIFILGRGVSYAAALESALKIKEVSYVHAEGFAAGELKHGVIALIEKGTPVILFNPEDETYEDSLSAAHEVKARGAFVIGVSSKKSDVYDEFIEVKNCEDATIIPNVVIAQLMGYYLAIAKGFDPDMPRNLAKSVTVK
ncbi:glutamine--fructose-6-phosphate transaminase (isomerizing) [Candidatus Roizmanbacteria bacterium]|nr:MAG: glutamine--fructose-6-phosphate transaminase (isomerizing) [Candidatus Roizmanbacteria bacterium]